MKNTKVRSVILYLLLLGFLFGIGYFVYSYVTNGKTWAVQPINKHLSSDKDIGGKIFDRNNVVLCQTVDGKRVYSDDELKRKALLHTVGDGPVLIPTSVQSRYNAEIYGYNLITGFGAPKRFSSSNDVKLTLDSDLCVTALKGLGEQKGAVVVYNYLTGEVVCSVSTPTYDPNNRPDIEHESSDKYDGVYINRVLSGSYTPGSIFKIITCAAAIDNIDDIYQRKFLCNKEEDVSGDKITCMEHHGRIDLVNAMSKSCNIAFADIAMEIGKDKMQQKAEEFGFNKKYTIDGVDIAESRYNADNAKQVDLGWSGIGQYNDVVNPMHMLMIMGAIANEGVPVEPYMVKSVGIEKQDGIMNNRPKNMERMVSADTANKIKDIMRYTIKNRYGDSMFPGMEMCAKTGTAEVGEGKQPHGWMVGFSQDKNFPYAFAVIVENSGFGIKTAGPIASDVMKSLHRK